MKPVFAIPLFLLALPMVAAETPMSYVRVIESYSPSRSEPAAFFDMARVTTTYFDGGWDAPWRLYAWVRAAISRTWRS